MVGNITGGKVQDSLENNKSKLDNSIRTKNSYFGPDDDYWYDKK